MDSTFFSFNNIKSEDMGVLLVKTESGMIGEPFLAEQEIVSEQVVGNPISYVYDFIEKPFSIKLTFALTDELYWTTEKRRQVARWLDVKKFCPMFSTDDVNKIYYLKLEGSSELYTNGNQQGYITCTFRSLSPYTYSSIYQKNYDLSTITAPTIITFENLGDNVLYPQEMWIKKYGAGNFQIKNLSDGGRIFLFTGLSDLEEVYVQNQERYISTSLAGTNRYDSFNGNYLKMIPYGINQLEVTGAAKIVLKYRFELRG